MWIPQHAHTNSKGYSKIYDMCIVYNLQIWFSFGMVNSINTIKDKKPKPSKKYIFPERKGLLLYEPINIEYFVIQWLKPVLRW